MPGSSSKLQSVRCITPDRVVGAAGRVRRPRLGAERQALGERVRGCCHHAEQVDDDVDCSGGRHADVALCGELHRREIARRSLGRVVHDRGLGIVGIARIHLDEAVGLGAQRDHVEDHGRGLRGVGSAVDRTEASRHVGDERAAPPARAVAGVGQPGACVGQERRRRAERGGLVVAREVEDDMRIDAGGETEPTLGVDADDHGRGPSFTGAEVHVRGVRWLGPAGVRRREPAAEWAGDGEVGDDGRGARRHRVGEIDDVHALGRHSIAGVLPCVGHARRLDGDEPGLTVGRPPSGQVDEQFGLDVGEDADPAIGVRTCDGQVRCREPGTHVEVRGLQEPPGTRIDREESDSGSDRGQRERERLGILGDAGGGEIETECATGADRLLDTADARAGVDETARRRGHEARERRGCGRGPRRCRRTGDGGHVTGGGGGPG